MRKCIGLGIVLGLCLVITSQGVRAGPDPVKVPDCSACKCAHSKAWRFNTEIGVKVLTTQPPNNQNGFGDPVSDARWGNALDLYVFSAICLQDFHALADQVTYNKWNVTNVSWNDNCQRLQGQSGGWVVVAVGTGGSQDPLGTAGRYDCGYQ